MIPPASGKLSMPYNTVLISTMAVSFVYALLGGMLAQRLRLSPLVGYLLTGVRVRRENIGVPYASCVVKAGLGAGRTATWVIRTRAIFSTRSVPCGVSSRSPTRAVRCRCFMI